MIHIFSKVNIDHDINVDEMNNQLNQNYIKKINCL